MLRFRKNGGGLNSGAGRKRGTRENHLEDHCAAIDLAGALSRAGSGRPQRQSVALFCDLCRCNRRTHPGIDAGRRRRHHRPDIRGDLGICRARSQQGAALDAGRLFRKHGVADRRRLRVLDRLPQERARPKARAFAGAQPRPPHHRARLCGRLLRSRAGAGDTVQHRAQRRHHLSDRQQHPAHLWLGTGADRRQDRHLCDVDGVCDHRGDELAVPDRAGAECGCALHRQEDRRRRRRLVAMVHRLCAARYPASDPGAALELHDLPAGGEGKPRNRRMEFERAQDDGAAVAQRMDHGRPGAAGDVPVDLRFQSRRSACRCWGRTSSTRPWWSSS